MPEREVWTPGSHILGSRSLSRKKVGTGLNFGPWETRTTVTLVDNQLPLLGTAVSGRGKCWIVVFPSIHLCSCCWRAALSWEDSTGRSAGSTSSLHTCEKAAQVKINSDVEHLAPRDLQAGPRCPQMLTAGSRHKLCNAISEYFCSAKERRTRTELQY